MKTANWFSNFPPDHVRIGISRGTPRFARAGYRSYRLLAPGPWFHSVDVAEYNHLYQTEVLGKLDPRKVWADLIDLAAGGVPCLLCYEKIGPGQWCHRAMAAAWLAEAMGQPVPELGHETLPQEEHPLMPPELRRAIPQAEPVDITPFIGREAMIAGERHIVIGVDLAGQPILKAGDRTFPTSTATLARHFGKPD